MINLRTLPVFDRYHINGYLDKKYYTPEGYHQPYSAKERYLAGSLFYKDFNSWKKGHLKAVDLSIPKVDCANAIIGDNLASERFRKTLKQISSIYLPILYKIILEQIDIKPPKNMSSRERLYFNDEVKTLLCRGLDELVEYYKNKKIK